MGSMATYRQDLKGYYNLGLKEAPGIAFCVLVAILSYVITRGTIFEGGPRILPSSLFVDDFIFSLLFKIGPIVLALIIGLFITWKWLAVGAAYSGRYLLRLAIVLMGARVTADVLAKASPVGLVIILLVMAMTIWFAFYLGRRWLIEKDASALVGTGNAVCGVSACLSVAPVIKAKPHNTFAVVGVISLLGLIGVFVIPWVATLCGLSTPQSAVFIGGSLHEVGNVIPAADLYHNAFGGQDVSGLVLAYKMIRVAMLVVVAYYMARMFCKDETTCEGEKEPVKPQGFLIAFVAVAVLVSLLMYLEPSSGNDLKSFLVSVSASLLTVAMAGIGLSMNLRETARVGRKLLPVAGVVWTVQVIVLLGLTYIFVH
jgi:uncharacterized integral membrane protein (TIGR00698 family)